MGRGERAHPRGYCAAVGTIAEWFCLAELTSVDHPMFIPEGNGYMGHLVCFHNYGPASRTNAHRDCGDNGEAGSVRLAADACAEVDAKERDVLLRRRSAEDAIYD